MDCVFCKIVNKETPSDIVWEDEEIVAFKDIRPSAPVHFLLVPKRHIESVMTLADTDRALAANLIYTAKELAQKQNLGGYKLSFNVGRSGGQLVNHLHLHLLGGWE